MFWVLFMFWIVFSLASIFAAMVIGSMLPESEEVRGNGDVERQKKYAASAIFWAILCCLFILGQLGSGMALMFGG